MKSPATVEDVARKAGVSRQTVSNVINQPEIVRPATRARVQNAIDELGYRPSAAARSLRTRRSSTIGIRLDPYSGGISGVLLDRFVHAIAAHAEERDLRVLIYGARSAEEEIARLGELVEGAVIDAVVVTGTHLGDTRTDWLTARNVPFVAFGRPWGRGDVWQSPHSWVDIDGAAGTSEATAYALEHDGPRVVWIGSPPDGGTGDDREAGWRTQMQARGLPTRALHIDDDVQQARSAVSAALVDSGPSTRIDAFVCASDSLAVGAHLALMDANAPDIHVIGFDNTPVAEALGLSSVEQAPELVADAALAILTDASGKRVSPGEARAVERRLITPRLVIRRSGNL